MLVPAHNLETMRRTLERARKLMEDGRLSDAMSFLNALYQAIDYWSDTRDPKLKEILSDARSLAAEVRSRMGGISMGEVRKKYRVSLKKGERVAEKVERDVGPLAETMLIAGSIRRRRPEIADVEFVVLPKDPDEFHDVVTDMGFKAGEKRRKYTGVMDGIKIELYVAKKPEELGSMLLWFTGDWKWNMVTNNTAKKRGYLKNQYGIWKGGKAVLQDVDERPFFDFLGLEWHEPEQRSLARRGELRKLIGELRKTKMSEKDARFVEQARERLVEDKYLPPDKEAKLERLAEEYLKRSKVALAGSRFALGAEELIELGGGEKAWSPRDVHPRVDREMLENWQDYFDEATGRDGEVVNVRGEIDDNGGIALRVVVVDEDGETVVYTPYYDDSPSEGELRRVRHEDEERRWLEAMTLAADWGKMDWPDPEPMFGEPMREEPPAFEESMGAGKEWSPRRKSRPDTKPLFGGGWDFKEWREPDLDRGVNLIWYGPGGGEGDYATEVTFGEDGYAVCEYQRVEAEEGSPAINKICTLVDFETLAAAFSEHEMPVREELLSKDPRYWTRWAVAVGVAKIQYHGGDEEWVEDLP